MGSVRPRTQVDLLRRWRVSSREDRDLFEALLASLNGIAQGFVGFANYARLASDSVFWAALGHNAIWVVLTLAFPLTLGLVLAAILAERSPRTVQLMSAIFFIPRTIPLVVAGIIWGWIYNPLFGLLNTGLREVGLGREPPLRGNVACSQCELGVSACRFRLSF